MRTVTNEIKLYTFNEASPELRDKIREYFHSDGFHYEHCMSERVDTLKAFADLINADLDYSLSCVPDRGEFISVRPQFSFDSMYEAIKDFINNDKDCPLTGVCYDEDLRDSLKKQVQLNDESLKYVFNEYINSIHSEYEYMLSDEYLQDMCEANEYEFTENGKIY